MTRQARAKQKRRYAEGHIRSGWANAVRIPHYYFPEWVYGNDESRKMFMRRQWHPSSTAYQYGLALTLELLLDAFKARKSVYRVNLSYKHMYRKWKRWECEHFMEGSGPDVTLASFWFDYFYARRLKLKEVTNSRIKANIRRKKKNRQKREVYAKKKTALKMARRRASGRFFQSLAMGEALS